MTDAPFTITHEGAVAHLRLNRPATANAMTLAFWHQFPLAIQALDRAATTRALVISGEGRHFCSGMDISVFGNADLRPDDGPAAREAFTHTVHRLQNALTSLTQARFPTIAAIQGACIGGALDLVSACDLRFAAEDAYFRIEEINIGMMADVGSLQRLPHLLPDAILRQMPSAAPPCARPRPPPSASSTPSPPTRWRKPSPPPPRSPNARPSPSPAANAPSISPANTRWPKAWPTPPCCNPPSGARPTSSARFPPALLKPRASLLRSRS